MDADRLVGSEVAGYAIESVLGRGGMGVVYLARQRSPNRQVALKLIDPLFADDDAFRRRFLREAVAAAAIDHPHIRPVYDAGEADGVLFLSMRLVDGEDLRAVLRSSGPLDVERSLALVGQIGGALDAAHARGLVHRDVKPGNILMAHQTEADDTDFCYLTDFGVSIWTTSSPATMTSADHMVGSMSYAAPEQIEGKAVDGRADLYSLGCVLYECLTGRAPFAGRSAPATLYAHLHEAPPPPSAARSGLPAAVDVVVARTLAKDPADRQDSCRELTRELRAALSGGGAVQPAAGATSPPRSDRPHLRPRSLSVVAAVVATALVIGLASVVWFHRNRNPDSAPGSSPGSSSHAGVPERIVEGVQVTASKTAPSSTTAQGEPVTYLPSNVIDGDVQTAWRAPGDGQGDTLTLVFDNPVDIVRIGLIPGYAKFDPVTGENRFEQERTITQARYLIPGLPPTVAHFQPEPFPQFVRVSATASRITVEIVGTTASGGRDFTAISEIYVYGYPQ